MTRRPINEKNWRESKRPSDYNVFLTGTIVLIIVGLGSLTARAILGTVTHMTNARLFATSVGSLVFALICLILLKYGEWDNK